MQCKIDGCDRDADYQAQCVCQKHYFRFMRNGYYEKKKFIEYPDRGKKYRYSNPAGYQLIYEPDHPLAQTGGYVYEHRFVYFNQVNTIVSKCKECGNPITWDSCHIDHIDEDVSNNHRLNLRALCRGCNVFRGHSTTSMGKYFLTIDDRTMTAAAWARQDDVQVAGATILHRKRRGMSDYDAIYSKRLTHHSTNTIKLECKYDKERGITQ